MEQIITCMTNYRTTIFPPYISNFENFVQNWGGGGIFFFLHIRTVHLDIIKVLLINQLLHW